jgi:hypothetical protein
VLDSEGLGGCLAKPEPISQSQIVVGHCQDDLQKELAPFFFKENASYTFVRPQRAP